jgi:hypothetical protein
VAADGDQGRTDVTEEAPLDAVRIQDSLCRLDQLVRRDGVDHNLDATAELKDSASLPTPSCSVTVLSPQFSRRPVLVQMLIAPFPGPVEAERA